MNAPTSTPVTLSLPLRPVQPIARLRLLSTPTAEGARFTVDGGPELEQHLARTCERITAGVGGLIPRRKLETILLGGGYGRGEGGVWRTPAGDRPYNDLEFYICIRGNRHLNELRFGRALHVLGEILTPQAGIDVEFKITSLHEIASSPVSMFSYDLLVGHVQLIGDATLLTRCTHHGDAARIPLAEATRLLMNRCSGLLFARERLWQPEFTAADTDFVQRNIAKAQLALGDALLVRDGQYHASARERHRHLERLARVESIPWLRTVAEHHAHGLKFKLHPERSTAAQDELDQMHTAVTELARTVFLALESQRLRTTFETARDYATHPVNKCAEARPLRTILINAKVLGARTALSAQAWRHPRERSLHSLALLLWEPTALAVPALLARIQCELRTTADTFPELVSAYRRLWGQVN
jgi:hypothetical protein